MVAHSIAAGRADLETALLVDDIFQGIRDALDTRLLGIVVNGRVPSTAISGQMGPSQGGTGNALGQATPLDGSVTDVKVAEGADIDPDKLNQTLLSLKVYLFVKDILLAGSGITLTPDDLLHTITILSNPSMIIPPGDCQPGGTLIDIINDFACRLSTLESLVGGFGLTPFGTGSFGG